MTLRKKPLMKKELVGSIYVSKAHKPLWGWLKKEAKRRNTSRSKLTFELINLGLTRGLPK